MDENYCTHWIKGFWNWACKKHDKCYKEKIETRLKCDNNFFIDTVKSNKWLGWIIAPFHWVAVRIGGSKYYKQEKKNMNRLKKSSTFTRAVTGVGALTLMSVNQESVADIINGVAILTGHGGIATTIITIVTGLLTLFGIGSGRLEAEKKPPLNKR